MSHNFCWSHGIALTEKKIRVGSNEDVRDLWQGIVAAMEPKRKVKLMLQNVACIPGSASCIVSVSNWHMCFFCVTGLTALHSTVCSTTQDACDAHCKSEEAEHWTSKFACEMSCSCPHSEAECWLCGPCKHCLHECEQWWHLACAPASARCKLEIEHSLLAWQCIGSRTRDMLLDNSLWKICFDSV